MSQDDLMRSLALGITGAIFTWRNHYVLNDTFTAMVRGYVGRATAEQLELGLVVWDWLCAGGHAE